MRVLGNAPSAYVLGQTQIGLPDGRTVKLADIAEVKDLFAEQRSISRMHGREVLSIGLSKAKGSSDVTVYEEVNKTLHELHEANPKVGFKALLTSGKYIGQHYHTAIHAKTGTDT